MPCSECILSRKDQKGNPKITVSFKCFSEEDGMVWMTHDTNALGLPACVAQRNTTEVESLHIEITLLRLFSVSWSDLLYHKWMLCQTVTTHGTTVKVSLVHCKNNVWRAHVCHSWTFLLILFQPYYFICSHTAHKLDFFEDVLFGFFHTLSPWFSRTTAGKMGRCGRRENDWETFTYSY